jgi:LysR family glycine cleavage system transcriptional activator/LysR family transcriptional regulator of beta-lactamase
MRKRQSLTALRAFEAVARHASFTKAAQELIVTRPAISKQIRLLEESLNSQLLDRSKHKITLTRTGKELFKGLSQAFDLIAVTTERIATSSSQSKTVKILVERDFASSWLAQRIGEFLLEHPGISVEIIADQNHQLHLEEDFSLRIFYDTKNNHDSEVFDQEVLCHWIDIPLCTTDYATQHLSTQNLENAHLLIDRNYQPWQDWFAYSGQLEPSSRAAKTVFNETTLCLYAALSSGGVAIGDSFLALSAIQKGKLITPFKIGLQSDDAYCILTAKHTQSSVAERAFLDWLRSTIAQYQQEVDAFFASQSIQIIAR